MKTFTLTEDVPQTVVTAGLTGLYAVTGDWVSGDVNAGVRLYLSPYPSNAFLAVGAGAQSNAVFRLASGDTLSVKAIDGDAVANIGLAWLGDGLV